MILHEYVERAKMCDADADFWYEMNRLAV